MLATTQLCVCVSWRELGFNTACVVFTVDSVSLSLSLSLCLMSQHIPGCVCTLSLSVYLSIVSLASLCVLVRSAVCQRFNNQRQTEKGQDEHKSI